MFSQIIILSINYKKIFLKLDAFVSLILKFIDKRILNFIFTNFVGVYIYIYALSQSENLR